MNWNYHRMLLACCSVLVFSSHIEVAHPPAAKAASSANGAPPFGTVPPAKRALPTNATNPAPPASQPARLAPYTIYLTFDDGPSRGSEAVDSFVRAQSLPVNVFLVGGNAAGSRRNRLLLEAYRRNPLVEFGNHSYAHAHLQYRRYYRKPGSVVADLLRSRDSLGIDNGLVRLPGRNIFRLDTLERDDHSILAEDDHTHPVRGDHRSLARDDHDSPARDDHRSPARDDHDSSGRNDHSSQPHKDHSSRSHKDYRSLAPNDHDSLTHDDPGTPRRHGHGSQAWDDEGNGACAADTLAAMGYRIFGWDLEWKTKPGQGVGTHTAAEMMQLVQEMIDRRKTVMSDKVILLLHDKELADPIFQRELEDFVRLARTDGQYRFGHLSELR